jgi:5'-deoxynucleotidase YfbR-like HD superfamily hydrolase
MVAIDHPLAKAHHKFYIFSIPEEENRLRETFAKSRYLFSQDLLNKYSEYEKNKQVEQGIQRATTISQTYSLADLTEMERMANNEYDRIKNAYEEITELEI